MKTTLYFTRDEKSNAITFLIKGKKTRRLTMTFNDFCMALMVGKEVPCKMLLVKKEKAKRAKKK